MFGMKVVNEALRKEIDEVSNLLRLQGKDELLSQYFGYNRKNTR